MHNVRESLWLPAAVLAIGVALMFVVLSAADGAGLARVGPAAYPSPSPCLFLPVIRQQASGANAAGSGVGPLQITPAPTAYPPPIDVCNLKGPMGLYLPIIQK
jgi:hypothetical protein